MKKISSHSKTSLFLMEMIVSLFFLALTCTICIRLYADAAANRRQARQLNHIQELTVTMGEIREGTSGTPEDFLQLLPGGTADGNNLNYYFDHTWKSCSPEESVYQMHYEDSSTAAQKKGTLTFSDSRQSILYEILLQFPSEKEAEP